jgi:hypothetical protein
MVKKLLCLTCCVMALALSNAAQAQDPSLAGWWKLDDGFGDIAHDSSTYGTDGTLFGGPLWINGRIRGALQFDGQATYVECGVGENLNITDVITVAVWVNTSDSGNGEINSYLMKGEFTYGIRHTTSNNIEFYIYSDGFHRALTPVTEAFNGQWHHLAGTYDVLAMKLYIDGELMATTQYSGVINRDNNYLLNFGRNNQGDSNNQWRYEGALDDIRIYNRVLSQQELQDMLSPEFASMPNPEDGAQYEEPDVVLRWVPGSKANTHDVYFGTVLDDVSNAGRTNQLNVLASRGQDANTYDPGPLDYSQTYYWRIDEVDAPPSNTIYKGPVWSFMVPFAFPIEQITATASSSDPDKGPENTVNGSGLDETGLLHNKTSKGNMWLSSRTGEQPTWIEFEFDKIYKLHEMWVWNSNDSMERSVGLGIKEAKIEYSIDGIDYLTLGTTHEFAQAPAASNYAHNTTIDFEGVSAKYVRITANSNWKGLLAQYGLSEVRFFYIPLNARKPNPDNEAVDVALDATLTWKAGREAVEHNVYFSSDEQAVIDGTAPVTTVHQAGYGPLSLNLGTTYYWRVDEVNNAATPSTWQSSIWNFSTQEYLPVEDFESYNDIPEGQGGSNLIYLTWIDGYNNPATNGSTMGYLTGASMETGIVHGGDQSAPVTYDNSVATSSEVTVNTNNLAIGRNWSTGSPEMLSLWFYGDPNNAATEQMYVKLNNSKVIYDGDPTDLTQQSWQQWSIDLAALGINLSNVTTLTIGFERTGATGGSGTVFIDDIQLYTPLNDQAVLE